MNVPVQKGGMRFRGEWPKRANVMGSLSERLSGAALRFTYNIP